MPAVYNNVRLLHCGVACENMKASANGRFSSLFLLRHDKCGGARIRESRLVKSPHFCGPLLQAVIVCVKVSRRENTDFRFWPKPQSHGSLCVDSDKFDSVHIFAPLKNKDRPACADCDLLTSPFLVLKLIYNYDLRKASAAFFCETANEFVKSLALAV